MNIISDKWMYLEVVDIVPLSIDGQDFICTDCVLTFEFQWYDIPNTVRDGSLPKTNFHDARSMMSRDICQLASELRDARF